jgi:hypothetical protein
MIKHLYTYCLVVFFGFTACNTEEGALPSNNSSFIKIIPGRDLDNPISVDELANGDLLIVSNSREAQADGGNLSQIRIIRLTAGGVKLIDKYYPENLNESWETVETIFLSDENIVVMANAPNGKTLLFQTNANADSLNATYLGAATEDLAYVGGSFVEDRLVLLTADMNSSRARIDIFSHGGAFLTNVDSFTKTVPAVPTSNVIESDAQYKFGLNDIVLTTSKNNPTSSEYTELTEKPSKDFTIQFLKTTAASGTICFGQVRDETTNNSTLFTNIIDRPSSVQDLGTSNVKHFLSQVKATEDGGFLLTGGTNDTPGDENNQFADFLLIKTNALGEPLPDFIKSFGNPDGRDILYDAVQAKDGNIFAVGTTRFGGENTLVLIKLDSQGNLLN